MRERLVCRAHPEYWPAVTDIPCPCGYGTIRWYEAGYSPGWRKCDVCGSEWQAKGASQDPYLVKMVDAVTEDPSELLRRSKEVSEGEQAKKQAEKRYDQDTARKAASRDILGSYHGNNWHAICAYWTGSSAPLHGREAYWEAWRASATYSAVITLDRCGGTELPGYGYSSHGRKFHPKILAISRSGKEVIVYRDGTGGTYRQTIEDALKGKTIEAVEENSM